ncbi:uncharacterized protein AMSG_05922 [Thecamonas trahens ATCC 50062]|uniref:Glycosyltransferase 61 catalytic domain-containing protein n=1 Tax=Thecamonas trahens ATCC 50062 TaxID=461836 RepID=A0A0L0DEB5_THETB|nr:hypothetical protein AMSG_05922 [Thecamonas trahens ATCC 50062]KNC49663.1 hypothetical protein AMSG_05922 [Thecamonas trahens ATCC 50062]|eukprot:XP_013757462.1 hypothetical protein AMSG_05922 [Thecamonas trahens ATCC 50062]
MYLARTTLPCEEARALPSMAQVARIHRFFDPRGGCWNCYPGLNAVACAGASEWVAGELSETYVRETRFPAAVDPFVKDATTAQLVSPYAGDEPMSVSAAIQCCALKLPPGMDEGAPVYSGSQCQLRNASSTLPRKMNMEVGEADTHPHFTVFTGVGGSADKEAQMLGRTLGYEWPELLEVYANRVADSPPDSLVYDDRVVVVIHDMWSGNFWHTFHNRLIRTFGTMATLVDEGLITCSAENPRACDIARDKVVLALPVPLTPISDVDFVELLGGGQELMTADNVVYRRIVIGASTLLDANSRVIEPRSIILLGHFVRWYNLQLGVDRPLPAISIDDALKSKDVPRLLLVERVRRRAWANPHEILDWARGRGLEVDTIQFEIASHAEVVDKLAAATIVVAVSGAGLTNLIHITPGTVVIDVLPVASFGLEEKVTTDVCIFSQLTNARGGVMIKIYDYHGDNKVPISFVNRDHFDGLLNQALTLGIHSAMAPSWTWVNVPPVESGVLMAPDDLGEFIASGFPGASREHADELYASWPPSMAGKL